MKVLRHGKSVEMPDPPSVDVMPDPREAARQDLIEHLDRQIEHVKQNSGAILAFEAEYPDDRRPTEGRCRQLAGIYLEDIRTLFAGWPEKPIPLPTPDPRDDTIMRLSSSLKEASAILAFYACHDECADEDCTIQHHDGGVCCGKRARAFMATLYATKVGT